VKKPRLVETEIDVPPINSCTSKLYDDPKIIRIGKRELGEGYGEKVGESLGVASGVLLIVGVGLSDTLREGDKEKVGSGIISTEKDT
jgi:hypothetical protein